MIDIENEQALINVFGYWPSFHDAEILSIVLHRGGQDGPSLEAKIHVFEMTSEIDPNGYYVLRNHTLVTIRFTHIVLEYLKWFNHQNVLWELDITEINPEENDGSRLRVSMPSSYGCEASFDCRRIIISGVEPFTPEV